MVKYASRSHFDGSCSAYFSSREVYDCYCDSVSEQNVLAAPAPAPVLAKTSDTGGSCFISDRGCRSTPLIQTDVFVIGWESWPTLSNVGGSVGNMTLVNREKAHLTFAITNDGYKVVQIFFFQLCPSRIESSTQ